MSFQLSLSTESVAAAYPDEPLFVAPEATVGEVLQLMRAQQNGSVLVSPSNDEQILGIFTERDALRCMAQGNLEQSMSEAMSRSPVCLQAGTTVGEAIQTMSDGGYRHLPILNEAGMATGMSNVYGIVHYLVDHFPQTIYNLPPKPGGSQSEREGA